MLFDGVTPAELARYGVRLVGHNDARGLPLALTPDASELVPLDEAIRRYRLNGFAAEMEKAQLAVCIESARHTIPPVRIPRDFAELDELERRAG